MTSNRRKWISALTLALSLAGLLAWVSPGFARVPGTRPEGMAFRKAAATASTGLRPVASESGRISASINGAGTYSDSSAGEVEKPTGATVRRAFLAAASAGFSGHRIADGEVTIDGSGVTWDHEAETDMMAYNYLADVTSLVSGKLDGAAAGRVAIAVREASSTEVDGVALVVIFDDPAQVHDSAVTLFFGAANPGGDQFSLGLANPLDTNDPMLRFELSLGISFSYQSAAVANQFSTVDVNGARLTSSAGGQDDGGDAIGALLTVGDLDDPPANPDPQSQPLDTRTDDERYDLVPFLKEGDTRVIVETANPSADDNLFLACFTTSVATEAGEALVLTPSRSSGEINTTHSVTATYRDAGGAPVAGADVAFSVFAGPNLGSSPTVATDATGRALFSYLGTQVGTDSIRATVSGTRGDVVSNIVTRGWTNSGGIGAEDTLALSLAPATATGAIGTAHIVTATLTVNRLPRPGQPVEFRVYSGPHAGATGADTTDIGGHAAFSYVGVRTGIDSIAATATVDAVDVSSNVGVMEWTGGGMQGYDVALTPLTAVRKVTTRHTVTATVRANGATLPGARVEFTILSGPNIGASGTDTTDATGRATFSYAGATHGVDTLRAALQIAGQSLPSNSVVVAWFDDEHPIAGAVLGLDIKPTSCVNPINTGSKGVTPVVLLGSAAVNVRDLDVATLRLEGVPPVRHHEGDESRPGPKEECGCSSEGPDGFRDLSLKFDTQAFVAALGPVADREVRTVTLTGNFKDGGPLVATDCIRIIDNAGDGPGSGEDGAGGGESGGPADSPDEEAAPRFALRPSAPNPFNPVATISYELPTRLPVALRVYDAQGRLVSTLVNGERNAGEHSVVFDARGLASGIYYFRMDAGPFMATRKMTLLK